MFISMVIVKEEESANPHYFDLLNYTLRTQIKIFLMHPHHAATLFLLRFEHLNIILVGSDAAINRFYYEPRFKTSRLINCNGSAKPSVSVAQSGTVAAWNAD